ncbi:MAG: acyl-CoA desaturase, partial [Microbacteriaceae bacterium]|nr:acyl-CoA desaturase [Microbacteriaceae bacterium]
MTNSASQPSPRIIKTGQRGMSNPVSEFSALLHTIRVGGLLHRMRTFYILTFSVITLLMAASWYGV